MQRAIKKYVDVEYGGSKITQGAADASLKLGEIQEANTALAKLIADADLPFNITKRKTFRKFVEKAIDAGTTYRCVFANALSTRDLRLSYAQLL